MILVSAARGKTGRHVIAALRAHRPDANIRALSRGSYPATPGVESFPGDMNDPSCLARAMAGDDTVIHYAPGFHPRETAMGTGMIDAAQAHGIKRFIYISVLHPEIEDLVNHRAKLAVESYLLNSRMSWTVLRPQHYMQNIDVMRVLAQGVLAMPYPVETKLGHVDLQDLAEAVAKVALEAGHQFATYDVAADVHLSVQEIAESVSRLAGKPIKSVAIDPYDVMPKIAAHWEGPMADYSIDGLHRLFSYYRRHGIWGNSNVLKWLLGRSPASFDDYVSRCLARNGGSPAV